MYKKFIILMFAIVITIFSSNIIFADENTISVKVNGEYLTLDQPPIIENGRTLIPFRAVLEAMGINVDWNAENKTIFCENKIKNVILTIGDLEMGVRTIYSIGDLEISSMADYVNLDVPAKIVNGRTMIPIRAIAECFNADVKWIPENKTVEINTVQQKKLDTNIDTSEFYKADYELGKILTKIMESPVHLNPDADSELNNILDEIFSYSENVAEQFTQNLIDQEKVNDFTERTKKYISQLEVFAEQNNIDISEEGEYIPSEKADESNENNFTQDNVNNNINIEENEQACLELAEIFQIVTQYWDTFDEKTLEEFRTIGDAVTEYIMENVNKAKELTSQDEIDKITEQYKEYIKQVRDFAEKNSIPL